MKKQLLLASLLLGSFITVNAQQVLQSENFNNLFLGNVGTDLTGATPGQGGILTFNSAGGTNAGVTNYQIVANDADHQNVLQITGSNAATGSRFAWKSGFPAAWAARTVGNDILEVEYEFFTGAATTTKNSLRVVVYNTDGTKVLCGFTFALDTKVLSGLSYYNNAGTSGNYSFNLGTPSGTLVLPANTWVKVGTSFDPVTGEVVWKGPGLNGFVPGAAAGETPNEVDMIVATAATNAVAGVALYDNLVIKASAEDTLLGVGAPVEFGTFAVYPNPASSVVNVSSSLNSSINNVEIVDLNGRTVKSVKFNGVSSAEINVSDLTAGVYMMNISSEEGTTTKKIIKN